MPKDVPMANRIESNTTCTRDSGRWPDQRLRSHGRRRTKQIEGWFDVSTLQGTVSVGRQEDKWATKSPSSLGWRMPQGIILSDRRRRRDDWHVEGVRRDGATGLGRPERQRW